MQAPQCLGLRHSQAAHSAGNLKLRRETLAQNKPFGAIDAGGQFAYDGLTILNRKFRPQLLIPLTTPFNFQNSFANFGG